MKILNISSLHDELVSVGLSIVGCDSSGNVQLIDPDTDNLIPLVIAAHEQLLTSNECLALQSAITGEQWLAYQDIRNAPMRQAREAKYKLMADALLFKAIENATQVAEGEAVTLVFDKADLDVWKTTKDVIRAELPYATDILAR